MSTKESKKPAPVIPIEEVKKEDTKGEKKGSGKTHKGPNAIPEKDDRKNLSGQKRVTPNAKRVEGAYIRKSVATEGEGAVEGEEEQKNDQGENKKPQRPKYERVNIYKWDRDSITLETPIPIKPTQKELLPEPRRDDLHKHLDELDAKSEAAKDLRHKKITAIITKDKSEKTGISAKWEPLVARRKELIDIQKVRKADHDVALAELKAKQETLEQIKIRVADLKSKIKKPLTEDDLKSQLDQLESRLQGEKITQQEEKKIVQQIEELKQSLPLAAPLQKLQEEYNEAYKETKKLKDKQGQAYKHMKEMSAELDEIKKNLDELKKVREEINSGNPEIEALKAECNVTLTEIKQQREELKAKFDADKKAYEDQQELLRYVEYVKKQHENLRKKQVYQKRDEERKKREEEEKTLEEEQKKSKYAVYVEIADLLIQYLEKLSGKGDKKDFLDANEAEEKPQQQNLTEEDLQKLLKKDKLTVLVSKKDLPDKSKDLFGGNNKKGKAAKNRQQIADAQNQPAKVQEKQGAHLIEAFTHSYDIMQQFEKLSVASPTFKSEIEKTIALLNEKKQYYIDLPNKEGAAEQHETTAANEKQDKKNKKQNKLEFDESSFPSIGPNEEK